jgi:hypothetical protein
MGKMGNRLSTAVDELNQRACLSTDVLCPARQAVTHALIWSMCNPANLLLGQEVDGLER